MYWLRRGGPCRGSGRVWTIASWRRRGSEESDTTSSSSAQPQVVGPAGGNPTVPSSPAQPQLASPANGDPTVPSLNVNQTGSVLNQAEAATGVSASFTTANRVYSSFGDEILVDVASYFDDGVSDHDQPETSLPTVWWTDQLKQRAKEGDESNAYSELVSCALARWARSYFLRCKYVMVAQDWHVSPERYQFRTNSIDPAAEHFPIEVRGPDNCPYLTGKQEAPPVLVGNVTKKHKIIESGLETLEEIFTQQRSYKRAKEGEEGTIETL